MCDVSNAGVALKALRAGRGHGYVPGHEPGHVGVFGRGSEQALVAGAG
jgi:hypothetical protein